MSRERILVVGHTRSLHNPLLYPLESLLDSHGVFYELWVGESVPYRWVRSRSTRRLLPPNPLLSAPPLTGRCSPSHAPHHNNPPPSSHPPPYPSAPTPPHPPRLPRLHSQRRRQAVGAAPVRRLAGRLGDGGGPGRARAGNHLQSSSTHLHDACLFTPHSPMREAVGLLCSSASLGVARRRSAISVGITPPSNLSPPLCPSLI